MVIYLGKMGIFMGLWAHVRFREGRFDTFPQPQKNSEGSGGFSRERWEVQPQGAEPRDDDDDDDDSGGYVGQGIQIHQDPLNSGAFSNNGKLGGGNSNILYLFNPIWGRFPIWLICFSKGLKPPITNYLNHFITPQCGRIFSSLFNHQTVEVNVRGHWWRDQVKRYGSFEFPRKIGNRMTPVGGG